MNIEEIKKQLAEKRASLNVKIKETRKLADNKDTKTADLEARMSEIDALKAEIDKLQKDFELRSKIVGLEEEKVEQKEERKLDNTKEGVLKGMKKVTDNKIEEIRSKFNEYMRSRGEMRDGLTTVGASVVIPTQILNVQAQPAAQNNLAALANVQTVSAPSGHLPILKKQSAGLVSAEELAANPDLAKPEFIDVAYDVQTFRGSLPVSQETIDDAAIDISGLVSTYVNDAKSLTEQRKLGEVLATATAATAASVDELKDVFNIQIPAGYIKSFVMTQSAYGELDKVKDSNGRYLLQDSIASASGKILFGAPVTVVEDTVLGIAGDKKVFVGDPKSFAFEAKKSEVTGKWVDDDIYGVKFAVFYRADFKAADTAAGKLVTLNFVAA